MDASPASAVPPELVSIIASLVPLRSAPKTLRSLALVNRRFYDIVRPLLYSRLILQSEHDAMTVIGRILEEPQLGLEITEMHIMSELSLKALRAKTRSRKSRKVFDVINGLHKLVANQLLPRLSALGIYLLHGWVETFDDKRQDSIFHGHFPADFWSDLHGGCPRLRSLSLRNVGSYRDGVWISGPMVDGISRISGLSVLRLDSEMGRWRINELEILKNIPRFAESLHTLSLKYYEVDSILSIEFPNLTWLCLRRFGSNETNVMAFFKRHPKLESLSILNTQNELSDNVEEGFLPNLKHLKAPFDTIHILAPILPQLISLDCFNSYNAQVPYLLRDVLSHGLPQLKSLQIQQRAMAGDPRREGSLWYETLAGYFHTASSPQKAERNFMRGYMHSIVRGAPNLEELGLRGMKFTSGNLKTLGNSLSQLSKLERFYYSGFSPPPNFNEDPPKKVHENTKAQFLQSAEALGRVCPRLESVTTTRSQYFHYTSGIIERDLTGEVTGVRESVGGVGMQISAHEDDPFPV